jgi:hypothetical protein
MILAFQLTGCTVIVISYLRNFSDNPVEITIHSKGSEISIRNLETGGLCYKNEILKVNRRTYKHLNDTLAYSKVDASTIKLILPAHSTVMLTPTLTLYLRWHDTDIYEVILRQNENSDTLGFNLGQYNRYDIKDPERSFKSNGGLVNNIFYYDYTGRK